MTSRRLGWLVLMAALMILPVSWTNAHAAQVTLAWDPPLMNEDGSTPPDVAGYRVYYGTSSGIYTITNNVGLTNSVTLTGLNPSIIYFFAVTAYSRAGLDSGFSSELQWTCDADTDGLPDLWELENFGGTQVPGGGAQEDFDGDGYLNREEFIAGTCATSATVTAILIVERKGHDFTLRIQTVAATGGAYDGLTRVYAIETASSLKNPQWTPLPGCERIVADGQLFSYTIPCDKNAYFRPRVSLE